MGEVHSQTKTAVSNDAEMLLRTENLTKQFGSFTAVDHVDLDVIPGELHSIIGPNGAGKTTLFNLITGAYAATEGQIWFDGNEVTSWGEDERAREGILRAFQITQLFPELTAHENLRLAAQSRSQQFNPLTKPEVAFDEKASELFSRMELDVPETTISKALSHGDKKKLEIAMALAADPKLLLLDEPTSGVSGAESERIFELIEDLAEDLTVLLIEHDVDLVLETSDRITVLHQGGVLDRGTPDEIIESEDVQQAYLGGY